MILHRILFSLLLLSLTISAFAVKHGSPVQEQIRSLKQSGQPVPGDLWHAAEQEYQNRLAAQQSAHDRRPPALDDGGATWQTATVINTNPYLDNGTTLGKGNEGLIPLCLTGGNDDAEDAWYVVTISDSVIFNVWCTCEENGPPSYDTRLGIFNSAQSLIACNDDAEDCGDPYYQSRIENFPLTPGTYYICVDGYDGEAGPYQLNAAWSVGTPCSEVGSIPTNPEIIGSLPFSESGTTVGMCDDRHIECELEEENNRAPDYWYRVTVDVPVLFDVWTDCGAQYFDTKIAIFDDQYFELYCNDDSPQCPTHQSRIENAAVPQGTYYIAVDGNEVSEGQYVIHVDTTHYSPGNASDWLPDITIREFDLYDTDIVTDIEPGHRHLILSNGTPNTGLGKLYIYGVFPAHPDGTQDVLQRIWRSDGSFYNHPAGIFVYHPEHDHIHLADWCIYRLLEVLPDSGVGEIVAEGEKTSFCIMDLALYDPDLPNHDPTGPFNTCATTVQGISVGWVDIYHKELPGQNIDITDVPDGTYWLEAEADPDNHLLESSETNNVNRVLVTIGDGSSQPDDYEPNDTPDVVDQQPVGGSTSPNLGPCNPEKVLSDLTIHHPGDNDYFRFVLNSTAGPGDYLRVEYDSDIADITIRLLDANRTALDTSSGNTGEEFLFLNGRPAGWYYAHVHSNLDSAGQLYTLTINPPANAAPSVSVVNPPAGNIILEHGQDAYIATWTHTDPENDECWVTLIMNNVPNFDGNEFELVSSVNTPAANGFAVMNSAYFPPGTYYVYAAVTDGGTTTGDWSEGSITWLGAHSGEHDHDLIPAQYYLAQNYPNPFNPSTSIRFGLTAGGFTTLKVYNIAGQLVRTILSDQLKPGNYTTSFAAPDLPSGTYIYSLQSPAGMKSGKMLLLK